MPIRQPSYSSLARLLCIAWLPLACAVGVSPEVEDNGAAPDGGGSSPGGALSIGGSAPVGTAGKATTGGNTTSGAFGGSASAGGKAGSTGSGGAGGNATGGAASGGAAASSGGGASAGSSSGGAAGAGTGGSGAGCACPAPVTWMDDTVTSIKPGDCVDVAGAKYLYTGAKVQTWANKQCNPTKQEAWCPDSSNDYKFMACQ
jgi:hypothetical protein